MSAAEEQLADEAEAARDRRLVATVHNTPRFFIENRQIAWVVLLGTIAWGLFGYARMPKAKDPTIDVRVAVAVCVWPGAQAEKIEQLVTRKMEEKVAENPNLEKLESISRTGVSILYITLKENVADRTKEWDNIQGRLDSIRDLPQGTRPIEFQRDFGDTATLMLTVASPKVSDLEVELRAAAVAKAITTTRGGATGRATLIINFPSDINTALLHRVADRIARYFESLPGTSDARSIDNSGFVGLDLSTTLDDAALRQRLLDFVTTELRASELHPDLWQPAVIRDPAETKARLAAVAGDRYTYRQLEEFTDQIKRSLNRLPVVAKVTRTGILPETIHLEYSQERLASYGLQASLLGRAIAGRNVTAPGGILEVGDKNVVIDPSGEFADEHGVGEVVVASSPTGAPVYLRELGDVIRDYESPARFLNYALTRSADGQLVRTRAITLAVNMQRGEQIARFADQVNAELARVSRLLPDDLEYLRTSDQPKQVRENVHLFLNSLYEAIALVVLVALIGFWEWRNALLLALCIPITLAMTFGMMQVAGVDIQQISIASLILALGLLVDVPVVASDAIKNALGNRWPVQVAAWLGPTKLATAIAFATITNIAAYLPFLSLPGDEGTFVHTLPIVLTLSLVASLIVSKTIVPLLGATILRAPKRAAPTAAQRRTRGFGRIYYRVVGWAIDHRKLVFVAALGLLVAAGGVAKHLRSAFFPKDLSYLSYIDVWLPEDATLGATRGKAREVERVIEEGVDAWAKAHGRKDTVLKSITEFDGGGGPRFWFSVAPELQQANYAQLLLEVTDKDDTRHLVPYLQARISTRVAGARVDVRELETGKPVGIPVSIRISGEDISQLRVWADKLKAIFRQTPGAERVRDDWGADTFKVRLEIDPDRANLANVTNLDIARSSAAAMNGAPVGLLRDGDHEIPILARLRPEERAQISDVENLYVNASSGAQKVPLGQVSRISYSTQTEKIRRRNQFRTITVSTFPADGMLPSEILLAAKPKLDAFVAALPSGLHVEVGGEAEEQVKSTQAMATVLALMLGAIYLALVVQFRNAIKPFVVFMAVPFGVAAAVVALVVMNAPFGFMAMLGIISLVGIIVSHIIVLFDFIEERHERGEPMREALLDAGLARLRPVLITVVATVLGLVPLALHGGPLWQPLCFAQIGGLTFATVVTLLLVPVIYTIVIEDLKLVRWDKPAGKEVVP